MKSVSKLFVLLFLWQTTQAQLFNPYGAFKPFGINADVGLGMDASSSNAISGNFNAGLSLRVFNFLVYRPNFNLTTKAKSKNYTTTNAQRWLHEICLHPYRFGGKGYYGYLGFYAAYDDNNRNYKFVNSELLDVETGRAFVEEFTSEYFKGTIAMQRSLPYYRAGISFYSFTQLGKGKNKKERDTDVGGNAVNIYLFYSFAAQPLPEKIITTQNYYNVNVPTLLEVKNASQKGTGFGFGMHIITSKFFCARFEFGSRPTLFSLDKENWSLGKAGFLNINLGLRLI
jgi:hypothetical protein